MTWDAARPAADDGPERDATRPAAGDSRDRDATRLAAQSLAAGDATGWFERLYAQAEAGTAVVPWDSGSATALLVQWAQSAQSAESAESAQSAQSAQPARRALVAGPGWAATPSSWPVWVTPRPLSTSPRRRYAWPAPGIRSPG